MSLDVLVYKAGTPWAKQNSNDSKWPGMIGLAICKCTFTIHSTNLEWMNFPMCKSIITTWQSNFCHCSNVKSETKIFPSLKDIMLGFVLKRGAWVFPVIPEICVKYTRSNASVCLTKYSLHHLSSLVSTAWWEEGVNNATYSHISPLKICVFKYLSPDPWVTKSWHGKSSSFSDMFYLLMSNAPDVIKL